MIEEDIRRLGFDLIAEIDYDIAKECDYDCDPSNFESLEEVDTFLQHYVDYVIMILRNYGFKIECPKGFE